MSGPEWLDGAVQVKSDRGGVQIGGPPRFVHHTYECGYSLDVVSGAKALVRAGNEVHFVFHPLTGHIAQLLPASQSARGLENRPGGCQTNRLGTVCLQVEVIARASRPWTRDLTDDGRAGLAKLVNFARAHGIPDVWPAGPPPAYVDGVGNRPESIRSVSTWMTHAGHYGHSQIPEQSHGDPGAIDVRALFATEAASATQSREDPMPLYVKPDPGGQPGDGYLAVTPTGVHAVTGAEWAVLRTDPAATLKALPRKEWAALRALADLDRGQVDVRALAAAIVALLPAGAVTADQVAERTLDLLSSRVAS